MKNKIRAVLLALGLIGGVVAVHAVPAQAAGTPVNTPVWFGAPFMGRYRTDLPKTLPGTHPPTQGGVRPMQVAMDYFGRAGFNITGWDVRLYAAPKTGDENRIHAFVDYVGPTCGNAARAGNTVRIRIEDSGRPVGYISYSHIINPAKQGSEISRWGGLIGGVFYKANNRWSCWDVGNLDGAHVHFEATNAVTSTTACMSNPQVTNPKDLLRVPSNYMGYIGYDRSTVNSPVCPPGI